MRLFNPLSKLLGQHDHHIVPLQGGHVAVVRDGGIDLAHPAQLDHAPLWAAVVVALGAAVIMLAPHRDTAQADLAQLQQQARDGEPRAMLQLAIDYKDGLLGLKADHSQADAWLTRAAEAGSIRAAALLGDAYSQGDGVQRDPAAAQHWWRTAAQSGNAHAEAELGLALEHSSTPAVTYEGEKLVNEAAAKGDPVALEALGVDHPVSREASGTIGRALASAETLTVGGQDAESLQQRARDGDNVAQYQLAMRYRDGAWGVKADPRLALGWLEISAEHGNPVAMTTLADVYAKGELGLKADPAQATLWRERATAARQVTGEAGDHA